MSNVCRHRMSTLLEGRGRVRSIVCPYHAWTYNLDGSLRGAPAMTLNEGFCKDGYKLPSVRCEEWLGWVFVTLNPDCAPVAEKLAEVEGMIAGYTWRTIKSRFLKPMFGTPTGKFWPRISWRVITCRFVMRAPLAGFPSLRKWSAPLVTNAFNYHTILKDDSLKIAMAHDDNTQLVGDERRTTFLLALYPSLLITLTPGYFWYLALHPAGPGQVRIAFGGGDFTDHSKDPDAQAHFDQLKELLDRVNIEDRGCTEKVFKGLSSGMASPGHLSHLERPNYDFAHYLNDRGQRWHLRLKRHCWFTF